MISALFPFVMVNGYREGALWQSGDMEKSMCSIIWIDSDLINVKKCNIYILIYFKILGEDGKVSHFHLKISF